jgi:hypothetical protein
VDATDDLGRPGETTADAVVAGENDWHAGTLVECANQLDVPSRFDKVQLIEDEECRLVGE